MYLISKYINQDECMTQKKDYVESFVICNLIIRKFTRI